MPDFGGSPRLRTLSLINCSFLASNTELHATPLHCISVPVSVQQKQAYLPLSVPPACHSVCGGLTASNLGGNPRGSVVVVVVGVIVGGGVFSCRCTFV